MAKSRVPKEEYLIPLGKAEIERKADTSKNSVTIIAWSSMVPVVLKASEELAQEKIEAEVIDIRSLYPLDIETVINSVQKTNHVVVVHQAVEFMGFGAEIVSELQEKAFDYLDAPIMRIAAPNIPPPSSPVLEKAFLPNERDVVKAVKNLWS